MEQRKPRFDYMGFANGGYEVGPQPGMTEMVNDATNGAIPKVADATWGNMFRGLQTPFRAAGDITGAAVNTMANGANRLLRATTGYEVPYDAALPTDWTSSNINRMKEAAGSAVNTFAGDAVGSGFLRKVPDARAASAPPGAGKVNPPSPNSFGGEAKQPGVGLSPKGTASVSPPGSRANVVSGGGIPMNPALTPMGSFQVEGGPKRSFSADASGAWYEGNKRMVGNMGASSNPAVNDIVNRILGGQGGGYSGVQGITGPDGRTIYPGNGGGDGVDRRGLPGGMTASEFVQNGVNNNGFDPGAATQLYYGHALPTTTQNFSAQQGADYNRGMLDNQNIKTRMDVASLPTELAQRQAMADTYNAHAGYYRTMSDPRFQLQLKGKDAETERMKSHNEILKTILPKAYESADARTRAALEANPNADAKAIWNDTFNNSLASFTDKFSQGQRYSPGVQAPGKGSWFGYNTPEVNIQGGWGSPDLSELHGDVAGAISQANGDPVKVQQILDRYASVVHTMRNRSQGIPTQ